MNNTESVSGPASLTATEQASSVRSWIFRLLTLAGAAGMVYSWFQSWWSAYIETLDEIGVAIYPYKMIISGTLRDYPQWLVGAEMPVWFFPLMWVYLAVCVWLLLYSLFTDSQDKVSLGKLKLSVPQILIGLAGLAYVVFVVVFPIVVSIRSADFYGVVLQGNVFISMNEHTESYVITALQPGYWIAVGTAVYLVSLAFLRKLIVGKA
ncbi:MAG TPA: hypothetical protein VN363_08255 [Anaerolineales bacterium]|nr:hypothetical protein [Anaerolineales bacterium]